VHTGFARFPGAEAAPLHRWGVGPYLDGLFSQSNLGVVTQLTLWLTPIPEHADFMTATISREASLPRVIEALQPLFICGVLRNPIKITNDFRCLSVATRYPWSIMGSTAPLPRRVVGMLSAKPFRWALSGVVEYATPRHRAPQRRLLQDALRKAGATVSFRSEAAIKAGIPGLWEEIFRPDSGFDVAATYWRKRTKPPRRMDPDRDLCGAIWCSPVVPLGGIHVARAVRIVERTTREAGLEPMMAITVLDSRTAHVVAPLLFDRAVAGEDERALACAEKMSGALERCGYYPYRLGVNSMRVLPEPRGDYVEFRQALKRALDPNGILSPGRYEP
jgi:4-cresol dehydrogenase (hydroxylating)